MSTQTITLTPYIRRYRRDLLRLVQEAQDDLRLHVHLDWSIIDDWINEPNVPIFLAWSGTLLIGVIAASPPQEGTAWLRLLALRNDVEIASVLEALWSSLRDFLLSTGITEIGALTLRPWLEAYLPVLGFESVDQIVTLRRSSMNIPSPHVAIEGIRIRVVGWRDVAAVLPIDHAAFEPLWQLSLSAFRQASREAASFTVAEVDGKLIGYQLSTLYRDGAHLARLAVLPEYQGAGVGGLLVGDMLNEFLGRGILSATVNTQESNAQSQRLYQRYDFRLTGLATALWKWKAHEKAK